MTRSKPMRNVAASVRRRLLNLAKEQHADFNHVLQRYAGERFLYRLGLSSEVDRFTLKGAALFLVWAGEEFRSTRDVDFLGAGPEDQASIRGAMETILAVPCSEDGLAFELSNIQVDAIRDEQEHGGVRVKIRATLGTATLTLQVDVGFGDVVTPEREEAEYPTLLDHPAPRVWIYPRETFVAEKFEAMLRLGLVNTRMKDFWDVAAVALRFPFDGETLRTAIEETFRARRTPLTRELPEALRPAFYEDDVRVQQWKAFLGKIAPAVEVPAGFDAVGERVRSFLGPLRESLLRDEPFTCVWPAGGPWQPVIPQIAERGSNV